METETILEVTVCKIPRVVVFGKYKHYVPSRRGTYLPDYTVISQKTTL
jgi:hypothetical protein